MIGIPRLSFLAGVDGEGRKPQSELGVRPFESKLAYANSARRATTHGRPGFLLSLANASLKALIPIMRNRKIPFRFFVRASLRQRTFSAEGMDDISDRRGLREGR